jgi:hypothetical protein
MSKLITASINVMKIDKTRLAKSKKGGTYLNLTIWMNDTPDEYGNDISIQQKTGKDEPRIYLGNGKIYVPPAEVPEKVHTDPPEKDDLPF